LENSYIIKRKIKVMSELKPVYTLRVTSIADIARFAATMLTLGQPVSFTF